MIEGTVVGQGAPVEQEAHVSQLPIIPFSQGTTPAGAVKYDAGKPQIFKGAIAYFPNAIEGVATVSGFGAAKYAWGGWRHVDNGLERYTDGMVRHLNAEAKGEVLDAESGYPHAWHVAWNALARAELMAAASA